MARGRDAVVGVEVEDVGGGVVGAVFGDEGGGDGVGESGGGGVGAAEGVPGRLGDEPGGGCGHVCW